MSAEFSLPSLLIMECRGVGGGIPGKYWFESQSGYWMSRCVS